MPETVLIIEDEEPLADLFASWLEPEYEVLVSYDGTDAIGKLDPQIDYILLDRRMPDMPGDEVLETIHSLDIDACVAMVTAVEPDYDIIEMGFDDYITKPVTQEELSGLLQSLASLTSYDDMIQQMYQLASKKAALETTKTDEELAASEDYRQLVAEFEQVKNQADNEAGGLNTEDLFKTLSW